MSETTATTYRNLSHGIMCGRITGIGSGDVFYSIKGSDLGGWREYTEREGYPECNSVLGPVTRQEAKAWLDTIAEVEVGRISAIRTGWNWVRVGSPSPPKAGPEVSIVSTVPPEVLAKFREVWAEQIKEISVTPPMIDGLRLKYEEVLRELADPSSGDRWKRFLVDGSETKTPKINEEQYTVDIRAKQIDSVVDAQVERDTLTVLYQLPGSLIGLSEADIRARDESHRNKLLRVMVVHGLNRSGALNLRVVRVGPDWKGGDGGVSH